MLISKQVRLHLAYYDDHQITLNFQGTAIRYAQHQCDCETLFRGFYFSDVLISNQRIYLV